MNKELKTSLPKSAQSDCRLFDNAQENAMHKPMPPLEWQPVSRLETPEEIARVVRRVQPRKNSVLQSMFVGLEVLVISCILLAAIVWWRLLT